MFFRHLSTSCGENYTFPFLNEICIKHTFNHYINNVPL
uniref:Uncharacterized protein n=1 Tax=Heterorhabditis bacteriophora TaxID=37862 RepID=A0A1I7WDL7_HETBA